MAAKLKVGDEVIVIPGCDKGRHGHILSIGRKHERVMVEDIMMMERHSKAGRSQQGGPTGGIETKEATIHTSNVIYYKPAAAKAELGNTTKKVPGTHVEIREKVANHNGKRKTVRVCMSRATGEDL